MKTRPLKRAWVTLASFTLLFVPLHLIERAGAQDARTADLIIVVDSSSSMEDERFLLRFNLAEPIQLIAAQQVDLHLIVISAGNFCLPAPIGNGACPDENLPLYRHVATNVPSGNLFQTVLDQHGAYAGSLRAGATRDILFVTDDNDLMAAAEFNQQLLAFDASFAGYVAHAAVHAPNLSCSPLGTEYLTLAAQTGGQQIDLCSSGPALVSGLLAVAQRIIARFPPPPEPPGPERAKGKATLHVVQTPESGVILNINGQLVDLEVSGTYIANMSFEGTQPTALNPTCSLSLAASTKFLDSRTMRGSDGNAHWTCTLLKIGSNATLNLSLTVNNQTYGQIYSSRLVVRRDSVLLMDSSVAGSAQ